MTETTDSRAAVVDSSGWFEFFGDGKKADQFAPYLEREDRLIVPPLVFYEVYKKLTNEASKWWCGDLCRTLCGRAIPFLMRIWPWGPRQ